MSECSKCGKQQKYLQRGLCKTHYTLWWRKNKMTPEQRERINAAKRVYNKLHATKNRTAINQYNKRKRAEVYDYINKYKADHGCIDCGIKDYRVLDFDHIADDKKKAISQLVSYSLKCVMIEIDKCVVRCANCHRIITHTRRKGD